jgi:hypothetical protein
MVSRYGAAVLIRAMTALLVAGLLAVPAAAAAASLGFDRGRHEIRRRAHQDFGAAAPVRVDDCVVPASGVVQCRVTARVRVAGGPAYGCRKYYRAQRTRRGVLVTESRSGRRFETFAPARCRPLARLR